MPAVTVELPGLTLTNEPGQQVPYLSDLKNWHDGTTTLRESEQRENGLGLYRDDDPEEAGRYPIVYGGLRSLQSGSEWTLREQVMALKNLEQFDLVVTDPTGVWRAEVVLSGKLVFEIHDDGWADFEIPLEAADPRKYGPVQISSTGVPVAGIGIADPLLDPIQEEGGGNLARVTVHNGGDAPMEPTVRIRGGVTEGFELLCIESARVIRCTRPIPDGSVVRVDNAEGVVWIDEQSPLPSTYLPTAEWFQVGPGETCTIQWTPLGATTGTPVMEVEWAEAAW